MTLPKLSDYVKRQQRKPRIKPAACPTEEAEQLALMHWVQVTGIPLHPELELLYHVPNAGARHINYARKMKRMGLKAGVPDLVLPVRRARYAGLYLELKRQKGGVVSPEQEWWHDRLLAEGYCVLTAMGWENARDRLLAYLRLDRP